MGIGIRVLYEEGRVGQDLKLRCILRKASVLFRYRRREVEQLYTDEQRQDRSAETFGGEAVLKIYDGKEENKIIDRPEHAAAAAESGA